MATKTFLKNVTLHSRRECQNFIKALEMSDNTPDRRADDKNHNIAKDMTKEQIRKIFAPDSITTEAPK